MSSNASQPALDAYQLDKTFQQALRLHERGRIEQAKSRYEKILIANPHHAGTLHMMGVLYHQIDRTQEAIELIERALKINPAFPVALTNLAQVYKKAGRIDEAITSLERARKIDPSQLTSHLHLAAFYRTNNRFAESLASCDDALKLDPGSTLLHRHRSAALASLNRMDDAIEAARHAVDLDPEDPENHVQLGDCFRAAERHPEALEAYDHALELNPDSIMALCNGARSLVATGQSRKAEDRLNQALDLDANCTIAHINLANLLHDQKKYQDAVDHIEKALEIAPDNPEAYLTLGHILSTEGVHLDALDCFKKAIEISPNFAEGFVNLGSSLQTLGEPEEALRAYEIALNLKPGLDLAYWNLALALLAVGRLEDGWSLFGYGFTSRMRQPHRPFPGLIWEGEPLDGKTIMVWREQGIGDDLRFVSTYHDIIREAKHVIIETDKRLVPLYQRTWPTATVRPETIKSTGRGDMSRDEVDFDLTAPAGMVASFRRRRLEDFPKEPGYLVPDSQVVAKWKKTLEALGPGPKIGIAWRSSLMTSGRAIYYTKIEDWTDLLGTEGVHFINLQYDSAGAEITALREKTGLDITVLDIDLFNDLDGSAALIKALDIVVTSGVSVADMAGAIGTPTFTYAMSRHPYLLGQDYLPWCPATRYYQMNPYAKDNAELVQKITADVRRFLGEGES